MPRAWIHALILCAGSWLALPAYADTELLYKELNLAGGLYTGEWSLQRGHPQTAVGFDWLRKYSSERGDWLTTGVQFRALLDGVEQTAETDLMTAYANFRRDQGRANLRLGKFEIPYGLEPVLDTHGTLLQSNGHHNLGDLWSWGVSLNGQLDRVDYELALLTGDFSENLPHREQESWLVAGRIGSPRTGAESAWGVSLAAGRTVPMHHNEHVPRNGDPHNDEPDPHGGHRALSTGMGPDREQAIDILRLGADYTRWAGPATWMAEGSLGTDDGELMGSVWARWEYTPLTNERWQYALQAEGVWHPPALDDDFVELSAQVSYRLHPDTTLRLLYGRAFQTITGQREDRWLLQYYYFGL